MENTKEQNMTIQEKIKLKKEELLRKQKEVELAEQKLEKFKFYKILTRKEIREIERIKLEKERQEFEKRKATIHIETNKAFEQAKKIRQKAVDKNDFERKNDEKLALEIEIKALKEGIEILKFVLNEKEKLCDDLLSKKMYEQYNLKKLRFFKNKNTNDNSEANISVSNIRNLSESYIKAKKELMDLSFKVRKYEEKFNSKICVLNSHL